MKLELHSPLSIEECRRKLVEKLEERVFMGSVKEQKISLRLGNGLRNPFAPYFQGNLERTINGTILRGVIKIQEVVKWAAILWCVFCILTPCIMTALVEAGLLSFVVLVGIENLRELGNELYQTLIALSVMVLLFPLAGVAFGIGFPALFAWIRSNDREKIVETLAKLLDATNHSAA